MDDVATAAADGEDAAAAESTTATSSTAAAAAARDGGGDGGGGGGGNNLQVEGNGSGNATSCASTSAGAGTSTGAGAGARANATTSTVQQHQHVRISVRYHYRYHPSVEDNRKKKIKKKQKKGKGTKLKKKSSKKKSPPPSSPAAPASSASARKMEDSNIDDNETPSQLPSSASSTLPPLTNNKNNKRKTNGEEGELQQQNQQLHKQGTSAAQEFNNNKTKNKNKMLPRAVRELCDFNGPGLVIGYGNNFIHGEYETPPGPPPPPSPPEAEKEPEGQEQQRQKEKSSSKKVQPAEIQPKRSSSSSSARNIFTDTHTESPNGNDSDDAELEKDDEEAVDKDDDDMAAEETLIGFDRQLNLSNSSSSPTSSSMTVDEIIAKAVQRMDLPTTRKTDAAAAAAVAAPTRKSSTELFDGTEDAEDDDDNQEEVVGSSDAAGRNEMNSVLDTRLQQLDQDAYMKQEIAYRIYLARRHAAARGERRVADNRTKDICEEAREEFGIDQKQFNTKFTKSNLNQWACKFVKYFNEHGKHPPRPVNPNPIAGADANTKKHPKANNDDNKPQPNPQSQIHQITYGLYVVYAGGKETKRMIRVFESSDLQDGDQCELIDTSIPLALSRAEQEHSGQQRMDAAAYTTNHSKKGTVLPVPPPTPTHHRNPDDNDVVDETKVAHDYDRAIDILKARYVPGSVLSVDLDGRRFFDAVIDKINPSIRRYASLTGKAKIAFKECGMPKFWVYLRFSSSLDSVGLSKNQWFDVQSVRHFILSRPEPSTGKKTSKKHKANKNKEESVAVVYNDMEDVASDTFTSPTDVSVGDHVSVQWDDGQDYTGTVIKVLSWVRGNTIDTAVDNQKRIDEATSSSPSSSAVAVCVEYDDGDICWSNVEEEDGFIILKRAKPKKRKLDNGGDGDDDSGKGKGKNNGATEKGIDAPPSDEKRDDKKKELDRSNSEDSKEIEETQQESGLDISTSGKGRDSSLPEPDKSHETRRKTWDLDRSRSKVKNKTTETQQDAALESSTEASKNQVPPKKRRKRTKTYVDTSTANHSSTEITRRTSTRRHGRERRSDDDNGT